MNNNIRWLRDKIKMLDMQGIIISNPINIKYLTGIEADGVFLITPKENIYITDGRYVEACLLYTSGKNYERYKKVS